MQIPKGKDKTEFIEEFRGQMLGWYADHARVLPWRADHGNKQAPYYVWLSEIMLQQTTVATVRNYFEKFISIWPSVEHMAAAPQEHILEEWAGLGYYARARNLHKCAKAIVNEYEGRFPQSEEALLTLPGIGPYTAAAISAIAFDMPASVMDGNIERIMARIFCIKDPLPKSKPVLKDRITFLSDGRKDSPGDFAQSLMDLGATICKPAKPNCSSCPVNDLCIAREEGVQESLPAKSAKAKKSTRYGFVYWIENTSDEIFIVRRPESGLLGGMRALPSSNWREEQPPQHLIDAEDTGVFITHAFTHFHLKLFICKAKSSEALSGEWVPKDKVKGLPTVFKKAFKMASSL